MTRIIIKTPTRRMVALIKGRATNKQIREATIKILRETLYGETMFSVSVKRGVK